MELVDQYAYLHLLLELCFVSLIAQTLVGEWCFDMLEGHSGKVDRWATLKWVWSAKNEVLKLSSVFQISLNYLECWVPFMVRLNNDLACWIRTLKSMVNIHTVVNWRVSEFVRINQSKSHKGSGFVLLQLFEFDLGTVKGKMKIRDYQSW